MKIALLHYSSPPIVGGVESVLAHHAHLMSQAGHEVTILAGRGESFDERIPVHVLPRLDSRHDEVMDVKTLLDVGEYTAAFDELRDEIKKELAYELKHFDVLIAHNVASLHKNLPLTAALYDLYKTPGFPRLILWHHDLAWTTPRYRHEMYDSYPWELLRQPWEGVTHVVVSELRRGELAKLTGLPQESIRVIPNGVDIQAFFKLEPQTIHILDELKLLTASPLFLLPVRITPRKNIELALQVMAELRKYFPEAMLLVTGPEGPHNPANGAYKQRLIQLRDEHGLQGRVHFLAEGNSEFLPNSVVADFYRLADALLFPSREEGFGIPLIEAGFSHIPVFCADIPVLRELGGDEVSYFDPDADPVQVADQIIQRMKGETTFSLAHRVRQDYSWTQIYALQIAPLLEEVCQ